jgi:hypothetical protein
MVRAKPLSTSLKNPLNCGDADLGFRIRQMRITKAEDRNPAHDSAV